MTTAIVFVTLANGSMATMTSDPIVSIRDVSVHFRTARRTFADTRFVRALDHIDLSINSHEVLGLVGESGSGKSTLGRCLLGLVRPSSGQIIYDNGTDIGQCTGRSLRHLRMDVQMVFQDPYNSLNPRMNILRIIGGPMRLHGKCDRRSMRMQVAALLEDVGLPATAMYRYPHEFSGGQRQRIAIARALATGARLLVLDEPTSALDVSVQAQILNLLKRLQHERRLTYLFISHDMGVVRHICDRVAVMYCGRLVEIADTRRIFASPEHYYTRKLLKALLPVKPALRGRGEVLHGEVPSPTNPPTGCRFNTRCEHAEKVCFEIDPPMIDVGDRHYVACHLRTAAVVGGSRARAD